MKHNKYWIRQKRFGYGVTPNTWEGWLTMLVFIIVVLLLPYVIESDSLFYAVITVIVLAIIWISKVKTKDPWEWRWG